MVIEQVLKDFFITQPMVQTAILYGSFSKGNETAASDVDIAVGGSSLFSPDMLADLILELAKLLNREIDLVDLNRINGTILTQILTKGTLIKRENRVHYAELIKKMIYFEEDMAPNIRYILDYRRERFLYG